MKTFRFALAILALIAGNFLLPPDQFKVLGGYTYANNSNRAAWTTDRRNYEPRFGISYAVNQKTVIRGGFGIYMAPHQSEIQALGLQQGFAGTTPFVATKGDVRDEISRLEQKIEILGRDLTIRMGGIAIGSRGAGRSART